MENEPELPLPDAREEAIENAIKEILTTGGPALICGAHDTGKSAFFHELMTKAEEVGRAVWLISADPAQFEIGPPLTLGAAHFPRTSAEEAIWFIGAVSPAGLLPEMLTGIRRLADAATTGDLVVVEMPGYVSGAAGRRLHTLTCELLRVRSVVAMGKGADMRGILAGLPASLSCHWIEAAGVEAKPSRFRSQRLTVRLAAIFEAPHLHTYSLGAVRIAGGWLGAGTPPPPHLMRYLTTALADWTKVYYAEQFGRHLGIMVREPLPDDCQALGIALEQFGAREATVTRAAALKNLVVGLESAAGKLIGLGRIVSIDLKRRTLGIATPVKTASAVELIRLGGVRVSDRGEITGTAAPGEL